MADAPAATPYASIIRERILLLLRRHDPTKVLFKPANISRENDASRAGLQAKAKAGVKDDFPQLEIMSGRSTEEERHGDTYGDEDGLEDDDKFLTIVHTFIIKIIHFALNDTDNTAFDAQVMKAIRKGGIKLRDPDTDGSYIPYVFGWEEITIERTREIVKEAKRGVSRISFPVRIFIRESEL